jgi:hypothetical protein
MPTAGGEGGAPAPLRPSPSASSENALLRGSHPRGRLSPRQQRVSARFWFMILGAIRDQASWIRRTRGVLVSTPFVPGPVVLIFAVLVAGADEE